MSQFTEQDAIELKTPLSLLQEWEKVMNVLWSFFVAYKKKEKSVTLKNKENEIRFKLSEGHQFVIGIHIYNNQYLSLYIKIHGNDQFQATVNNINQFTKEGIIKTVAMILTYAENVKSE